MSNSYTELDVADLVGRARDHDRDAWAELVRRYAPVVWRVARAHCSEADAKDVSQHTWITLAERLSRVRDPDRLAGWLATTARREALRLLASRRTEAQPDWWPEAVEDPHPEHWPEPRALRGARDRLLWRAFAALPERCQRLLGLLAFAPELTYAQLGTALGIKLGTVGPVRGRCLHELRRQLAVRGLCEGAAG
jgi:RNA polymerase sigma factor (sigma-70 family)